MLSISRPLGLMARDVDAVEAFAGRGGVPSDSMLSIIRAPGRAARDVDAAEAFVGSGFPLADTKNRGGLWNDCVESVWFAPALFVD